VQSRPGFDLNRATEQRSREINSAYDLIKDARSDVK